MKALFNKMITGLAVTLFTFGFFLPTAKAEPWRIVHLEAPPLTDHVCNDVAIPSSSVIYVACGGAGGAGPGVILKSIDGGDSWASVDFNLDSDPEAEVPSDAIYAIDCESTSICYGAGAGGYFYKKGAGSETWSRTSTLASSGTILNDIKVVAPSIVVAVGSNGKIFRTTTAGASWGTPIYDATLVEGKTLESVHFGGPIGYIWRIRSNHFKIDG